MELFELLITKSREAELAQYQGDFEKVERIIKEVGELTIAFLLYRTDNLLRLPK